MAIRPQSGQFAPQRRPGGSRFSVGQVASTAKILAIHNYRRVGRDDALLAVISRDPTAPAARTGKADGLYWWKGTPKRWVQIWEFKGTNLIYDLVDWQTRVYIADGRNTVTYVEIDPVTDAVKVCPVVTPVVQYLIIYQERLVGAGDNRTKTEVEADGGIWPADSNRDRVRFTEVLEHEEWLPNNFIDTKTGNGETISGLGINAVTTTQRGAQTQLAIFKPHATMINDGALGSGDQRFHVLSETIGCPADNTIVPTPYGLMFCSTVAVCMLSSTPKEPDQVGFVIHPEIEAIPETSSPYTSMRYKSAAIYHNNTYKLSIAGSGQVTNTKEWWFDLRPGVFPEQANFFGPHSGDFILQYEIYASTPGVNKLVGAQFDTIQVWELDQEGLWGSMSAPATPRTSTMTWARVRADNMKEGLLDAYGFSGQAAPGVSLSETVDLDRGTISQTATFTTPGSLPADNPAYNVIRPFRRMAHDAQVSIAHSAGSDIEVHQLYVRARGRRRQSEKQKGSTQS